MVPGEKDGILQARPCSDDAMHRAWAPGRIISGELAGSDQLAAGHRTQCRPPGQKTWQGARENIQVLDNAQPAFLVRCESWEDLLSTIRAHVSRCDLGEY